MKQQQHRAALFYSCHQSDDILRDKLARFLRPLVREAHVEEWSDEQVLAGTDFAQERKRAWESATHILLLLSADYLASEALYQEMLNALKRQERGEARIIPVLLRPCLLPKPLGEPLSCLPDNGHPVSTWKKRDEALFDIARDICLMLGLPLASLRRGSTDRDYLLDQVFINWVEGLLEPSLEGRPHLDLALQEQPDALAKPANPWSDEVQDLRRVLRPLPTGTNIGRVYNDAQGELLILGESGTGKTTLLLELTRMLLMRAEKEERARMPVVFPLSSWAKKKQALDKWLVEELRNKYGIPRKIGERWINDNAILPLLDGLDEIVESARAACVQAIETYHTQIQRELVVCCRRDEYLALPQRLTLQRAVCIQQLTDNQIEHYLQQAEQNADELLQGLRQVLHKDRELNELAHRPLMLNIFTLAYQGATAEEVPTGQTREETLHSVFASYVQRMLNRRGQSKRWEQEQVRRWLTFLAKQMHHYHQNEFYLEYLQPGWLGKWNKRLQYHLSVLLIAELLVGLVLGVVAGLLAGLNFGLAVGLRGGILGFFCGLVGALVGTFPLTLSQVHLREALLLSWERAKQSISVGSRVGVLNALIAALFGWFTDGSIAAVFFGLTFGLINGLIASLVTALSINQHVYQAAPTPSRDQRIWRSIHNGMFIGLSNGMFIVLSAGLSSLSVKQFPVFDILLDGLGAALLSGLIAVLGFGLGKIDLRDTLTQSRERTKRSIVAGLIAALLTGSAFCLLGILAGNLFGGLLLALIFGLLSGLVVALVAALSTNRLNDSIPRTPNQGIWRSARNGLVASLPIGLVFGLLFGLIIWSVSTLVLGLYATLLAGLAAGLIATLFLGLGSFLQHFILRFWLWKTNSFPWNLVAFLDEADERLLLRKVGGGYIFIHRHLLEYFASKKSHNS